jgi:hypothetical protein
VWWALPVGSRPVPHRGYRTPMYRPELCARPGVSAKPPLLCHSLRLPSGAWGLTPQPGFPDTPRLFVGLSAGPVGRTATGFLVSPTTGGGGRWSGYHTIPDPTFGTRSQSIAALTCPGRPTSTPGVPPGYVDWGSSDHFSAIAHPVECRASPHFLRHAASPATQRVWGNTTLRPPAPGTTRDVGPLRL